MTWLDLAQIAELTGGRLIGAATQVSSVSIDTRHLEAGELFVALCGPRFDAHDFVARGAADRAAGLVVSRAVDTALPQVLVDDTGLALARLAEGWRERLAIPIVGLTGSNGKTTVKEMIGAILAQSRRVHVTQGNLNNHIGVPLTLLSIRPEHAYAVVEMGANHPGEIGGLTDLVRPDVALITNAAPAHLEGFRDLEGVARAKGEIFSGLAPEGVGIVNANDPFAPYWRQLVGARRRCLSFALDRPADVRGTYDRHGRLVLSTPRGEIVVTLSLHGRHNAQNALAAAAAALALEIPLEQIGAGLEAMRPVGGRLVPRPARNGAWILDDSYNANPSSFKAAVEVLVSRPGTLHLVLGDMGELGEAGPELHHRAGEFAREMGVERLYAFGPLSRATVEAFGPRGESFADLDELVQAVSARLSKGATVLVKGSRAMHMERVVEALRAPDSLTRSREGEEHAA